MRPVVARGSLGYGRRAGSGPARIGDATMDARKGIVALLLALASTSVWAQEEDEGAWNVGGGVWLLSDYVWRGVSQTQEDPALQAEIYVEHASGFYGGVWASQIDFTAAGEEPDGIHYEIDPYVGWNHEFSDSLSLDLTFTKVLYPGSAPDYDFDYDEFEAALGFGGHYEASIAYSDDIFNLGGSGIYYHLQGEWELDDAGLSFVAGVGHYDLDDAAGDSYQDWMLALGKSFDAVKIELQVTDTASYGEALQEALDEARLADARAALVLSWEF
jgi:uncharacterized protein (TIGR02001 family)